jgi:hypothetical protein
MRSIRVIVFACLLPLLSPGAEKPWIEGTITHIAVTNNRVTGIPNDAGCCREYTIEADKAIYTVYQYWYYKSAAPDLKIGDHLKLRRHSGFGLYSISSNVQVQDDKQRRYKTMYLSRIEPKP